MTYHSRLINSPLKKELQKLGGLYLDMTICSKLLVGAIIWPGPTSASVILPMSIHSSSGVVKYYLPWPHASLHGSGVIVSAAGYGRLDILRFLLGEEQAFMNTHSRDPQPGLDNNFESPLHVAAAAGEVKVAKLWNTYLRRVLILI